MTFRQHRRVLFDDTLNSQLILRGFNMLQTAKKCSRRPMEITRDGHKVDRRTHVQGARSGLAARAHGTLGRRSDRRPTLDCEE